MAFTGFIFSITMTTAAVTLFMLAAMPFIAAIVGYIILKEKTKAEYQRRYRIAKAEYDRVMETMPKATVRPRKRKTVKGKKKQGRRTAARKRKTSKLRGKKRTKRRATTKSKKGKSTRKYSRKKCRKKKTNSSTRSISKASYSRCSDAEVDGGDRTVGGLSLFGHRDDLDYFEGK